MVFYERKIGQLAFVEWLMMSMKGIDGDVGQGKHWDESSFGNIWHRPRDATVLSTKDKESDYKVWRKLRINVLGNLGIKTTNEWYMVAGSEGLYVEFFRWNGKFYQSMKNVKVGIDWTTGCCYEMNLYCRN